MYRGLLIQLKKASMGCLTEEMALLTRACPKESDFCPFFFLTGVNKMVSFARILMGLFSV